jgi:hypothetical protein
MKNDIKRIAVVSIIGCLVSIIIVILVHMENIQFKQEQTYYYNKFLNKKIKRQSKNIKYLEKHISENCSEYKKIESTLLNNI